MCDMNDGHEHGAAACTCETDTASEHGHQHGGKEHHHAHAGDSHAGAAMITADYGVQGMTCSHCVSSVTEELSQLAGVRGVSVDLVAGGISRVTVNSETSLDDEQVAAAIDEAGYDLADLPR